MPPVIRLADQPSPHETRAAAELRRYWHQLTGEVIGSGDGQAVLIGTAGRHPELDALVAAGRLSAPTAAESYTVRTVDDDIVAVLGADPLGALYGTYRLLTTLGIRFYLNRDVLPAAVPERFGPVDLSEAPAVARRGLLPWHDFLNGPSGYAFEEFRRYLDQLLKLRMNTLVLHNYSRGYHSADINEPFLQFSHDGVGFDGYLDTSIDNVRWGMAPTRADDLAFDAADVLSHDVLASDVARFTRGQPDARNNTFAKGKTLIQRVLAYAQHWGMEVVLGTDFDLVPRALEDAGCVALDPATLRARVDDVVATYPQLRYLQLYYSESHNVDTEQAITAYQVVRDYLAEVAPQLTLLTGSWFQEERFPQMDSALSKDIAFSSLLPHDMTVKPEWAQIAARRPAWAIPWIEVDGGLCEPQLALGTMQRRLPELRASGVEAVIGILWRERPVEVNVAYLADDLWQSGTDATSAAAYYRDYASSLFGAGLGEAGAALFADVETAGVYGKETTTRQFDKQGPNFDGETTPEFGGWFFAGDDASEVRATRWARIADAFDDLLREAKTDRARDEVAHWRDTARWMQWYWRAHYNVPRAVGPDGAESAWDRLLHSGFREAIDWHVAMVRDLPMVGGLLSAAGGRWYFGTDDHAPPIGRKRRESYRQYEDEIVAALPAAPPTRLSARRTAAGVRLRWSDAGSAFHVYRALGGGEPIRLTQQAIPAREYLDPSSAAAIYTVRAVGPDGALSVASPAVAVAADDDSMPLRLLVLPQPQTCEQGEAVTIAATVLSGRGSDELSATLRYRAIGGGAWHAVAMRPSLIGRPNTFYAAVPADAATEGFVYSIEASDGHSTVNHPPQQGELAAVTSVATPGARPGAPTDLAVRERHLTWRPATGEVAEYRIFATAPAASEPGPTAPAATEPGLTAPAVSEPGPADYVTYVPAVQHEFALPDEVPAGARLWVQAADRTGHTGPFAST